MLAATAAFDAGVGLERDDLRDVFAGVESEILVAGERGNLAEAIAFQEDGERADDQMEMFGVRDQRQEGEDGERVGPPQPAVVFHAGEERGEVGGHEGEDEERDESAFGRDLAEPARLHQEAADGETGDGDGDGDGEERGESEIETAEPALAREKIDVEALSEMVDGDQAERAEAPEDEGVGDAGKRALPDDFGLADHFPKECPGALVDVAEVEVRVALRSPDALPHIAEAKPEAVGGGGHQGGEQRGLNAGQLYHKR